MTLRRFTFLLLVALLLHGWPAGVPSAFAQKKGDLEPKEGELADSEKLGKLTLTIDPGWHTGRVNKVYITPDSQQVITLGGDRAIRIWDAATGEMHKVLYPPGFGTSDLSGDGKRLAVTHSYVEGKKKKSAIHILALPEGRIERILMVHDESITQPIRIGPLAISRDGKMVAFISSKVEGQGVQAKWNKSMHIWNLNKDEPPRQVLSNVQPGYNLALSPDGTRLAGLHGGLIDLATGKRLGNVKPGILVAWSPDGKTLASAGGADTIQLNDANGKEIRLLRSKPGFRNSLTFSGDSRTLLCCSDLRTPQTKSGTPTKGETVIYDVATGAELQVKSTLDPGPGALSPDGQFAVAGGDTMVVWKTENGDVIKNLAAPKWRQTGAAWSPDGMSVSWSQPPGDKDTKKSDSMEPSFDLRNLELGPPLTDSRGAILKQGPWTIVQSKEVSSSRKDTESFYYRVLKDGKQTRVLELRDPVPYSFIGKDQIVYGLNWLHLIDAENGGKGRSFLPGSNAHAITSIAPSPDSRFFLTTSSSGGRVAGTIGDSNQRLKIWSPEQHKPLLTMYRQGSDWILWTPEGYYAANPGGERLMGWVVDNGPEQMATFYPAERFRKQMYRPDIIKLIMEKGNLKDALETANAALKQAGTRGVAEGVADLNKQLPPQATLEILSDKKDLPSVKMKVNAVAAVKEQPVIALRLLVDGRGIADEGSTFVQYETPQHKAEQIWTIKLPPGKHQLAVLAKCADSASISNAFEIDVADPDKLKSLHVLAIGVNNYEDPLLKLNFAVKDAEDIAANFQKCCKGDLYHDVHSAALVDARARKDAILKHLAEVRKRVKPNDLAVVFFAGHGVKAKDKFYLLPVEANTTDLAKTAISGEELRKSMGEFPCQVLLMLDACHSSGSLKNFRPAVDDITRNLTDDDCGVAVMCAAMANEKALEKNGNSLFTRAVVQALNRAEGVPFNRHNRLFYVNHLHTFVLDEVREQSGDRQHPTYLPPTAVEAFPLAKFAATR